MSQRLAHRPEREDRDHRVLGGVERPEKTGISSSPASCSGSGTYQTASVSNVVSGRTSGTRSSVDWSRIDFFAGDHLR